LQAQAQNLMHWTAVGFGLGIAAYFGMFHEPGALVFLASSLVAGLSVSLAIRFRDGIARFLIVIAAVAAGFAWCQYRAHAVFGPVLSDRFYGAVQGRVIGIDRSLSERPRLTLDELVLETVSRQATPRRIRVALHGMAQEHIPQIGDTVLLAAHLSPPPGPAEPYGYDFQRQAWFAQLGAVGYTRSPVMTWRAAPADRDGLTVQKWRQKIGAHMAAHMPTRTAGVAVAITVGDRMYLDRDVQQALRAANLSHLLAISGLHMGLLTSLVFFLTRALLSCLPYLILNWPIKKIAALMSMGAGAAYLMLSGASVATERAYIMAFTIFAAMLLERRALTLQALAIAAILVLLLRPEALLGPGFQMSFAATGLLIIVFNAMNQLTWVSRWPGAVTYLIGSAVSAMVAGLATAPIAAAHFNLLPHYGVLANVIAVPIMGFVVMPSAILAAALAPFGGEALGLWGMTLGLGAILDVASYVADLPHSVSYIKAPPPKALGILAASVLFGILWRGRMRILAVIPAFAAMVLWINFPRPDVLISGDGRLIGVMVQGARVLNAAKGSGFVARSWLENDGRPISQSAAHGDLPSWIEIVSKGSEPQYPCQARLVVVQAWRSDLACDGVDLGRLATAGGVAGRFDRSGRLHWITVRQAIGHRLWNSPELRRAKGCYIAGGKAP
jgi:competence protein ComEC